MADLEEKPGPLRLTDFRSNAGRKRCPINNQAFQALVAEGFLFASSQTSAIRCKRQMSAIAFELIRSGSDEEVFSLLGHELERLITSPRGSPEFIAEIQDLPPGLRAMAATYELDVSLALDDLGWHFGNWHSIDLAQETAAGLDELGARELAEIFRAAFDIAQDYWMELGSENWMDWYHGSALEKAVDPLTCRAWAILKPRKNGIFSYWVEYAREHPQRVGAGPA